MLQNSGNKCYMLRAGPTLLEILTDDAIVLLYVQ